VVRPDTPENLQVGERPDLVPDTGQTLVRTHAAGVGIWNAGPAWLRQLLG
jgi:NADPH:quinone reductase-like Zn-dependent oxidoreductase